MYMYRAQRETDERKEKKQKDHRKRDVRASTRNKHYKDSSDQIWINLGIFLRINLEQYSLWQLTEIPASFYLLILLVLEIFYYNFYMEIWNIILLIFLFLSNCNAKGVRVRGGRIHTGLNVLSSLKTNLKF